jgi:LGFP repeat/Abnormal spindle-like microcephaly-assoc'd, ASPM-SPD-2-Hydin
MESKFWPTVASRDGELRGPCSHHRVTSTPVYDPTTDSVYVLAKVNDGPDAAHPSWYTHALNPATGLERPGWPMTIRGAPSNDPVHPFNPATAAQRPGLLLLDGVVYAGFASHCDHGPYVGYVVGVSTVTARQTTMWSTEAGSSYSEGGIWQSGGGLVSDGPGRILLTTGNGVSPPPGPGSSPPPTLAESVARLAVGADGNLSAVDYFSPYNNVTLDQDDTDLGSGGPMALPAGFGTSSHPRLMVQAGKDGRVFLLDRDDLGGTAQGPAGVDAVVSVSGPYQGVWGHPAFWGGAGGYVYTVENGGYLRAHKYVVTGDGSPALASAGTSRDAFGLLPGSPVVTSVGTTPGSALVWVIHAPAADGEWAELSAYDAVPVDGVLALRFSAPIGVSTKFSMPATEGGRVYVGTRDGRVIGFGAPTTAALTGPPADLGSAAVDTTVSATITVTATRAVTVTGMSTTAPFAAPQPSLPRTLPAGAAIAVPVSFTPTRAGAASAALTFTTDAGSTSIALSGVGTRPGLGANPQQLTFGTVPTGGARNLTVDIANTGTASETITGVTVPAAPFTVTGVPAVGRAIPAGGSIAVSVGYQPTVAATDTATLRVDSDAGSVVVPLSGTAVSGNARLDVFPNPLQFGSVPIGMSVTRTFDISNDGNINLIISKAAPPTGVFGTDSPISEGQRLSPGDVLHQPVTFTPTATGPVTAQYELTSDDGRGAQNLTISGTGMVDAIAVRYHEMGGQAGPLSDPLSSEYDVPGGRAQDFRLGRMYWSPTTGAHVVNGLILDRYLALGGPGGFLAFPLSDETPTPDGAGRYNHFSAGGSVYWSPATGAHEVHGAIRSEWEASGWEQGPLGYPVTDEMITPDGIGRYNHFSAGGSVYWSPATGAHEVHGAIRNAWEASGWEQGPLGYPVTNETATPDGVGRYNYFSAGGSVYWSPATGAHEVHGAILQRWAELGWELGPLGYPVSDEYDVPGGRRSDFSAGSLTWYAATGRVG